MNTNTLGAVAERAGERLVELHARLDSGEIAREDFLLLAVAQLDISKSRAVALADLALAVDLTALRGAAVLPIGLPPPPTTPAATVADVLDGEPYRLDAAAAVAVLGRAESLAAAQDAYGAGMQQQGVSAWTRQLNGGACKLCQDLAGDVLPASAPMYHHRGCGCSQRPIEESA